MSVRWLVVSLGLLIGSGMAVTAWAQAASSAPSAPSRYVPPKLGAPKNRVSGATRGPNTEAVRLDVLAPPDVGLTTHEQPTLYWFNSRPIEGDAAITIVDDASDRTVLKAIVPGPLPAGINSFRLAGTRGRIGDNTAYRWTLTLVLSKQDPAQNPVASGMIERVARPAPAPGPRLWYDAVDAISQSIRRAPGDQALRETRSALLEQAGLIEAAAYDRAASR